MVFISASVCLQICSFWHDANLVSTNSFLAAFLERHRLWLCLSFFNTSPNIYFSGVKRPQFTFQFVVYSIKVASVNFVHGTINWLCCS